MLPLPLSPVSPGRRFPPKVPHGQKGLDQFETPTGGVGCVRGTWGVHGQDTHSLLAPREGSKLNGEAGGVRGGPGGPVWEGVGDKGALSVLEG